MASLALGTLFSGAGREYRRRVGVLKYNRSKRMARSKYKQRFFIDAKNKYQYSKRRKINGNGWTYKKSSVVAA